jgi:NADH-quinone oxidoreductase subunit L
MTLVITGIGFAHSSVLGRLHAGRPGVRALLRVPQPVRGFMLVLVLGASYPLMFVGWEGVGLCVVPADRVLVQQEGQRRRGQEGVHRQPHRRLRDSRGDVPDVRDFGTLDFVGANAALAMSHARGASRPSRCSSSSAARARVRSCRCTSGCPTRWPARRRSRRSSTPPRWSRPVCTSWRARRRSSRRPRRVADRGAHRRAHGAVRGDDRAAQWDIKKVLAYSTVSQLGYMFVGVGVGAYTAGVFHLVTHAFFKALLFLGSGSVIYAMHQAYHARTTTRIRRTCATWAACGAMPADVRLPCGSRRSPSPAFRRSPASSPRTRSWPRCSAEPTGRRWPRRACWA